jgi:hypothetical protein
MKSQCLPSFLLLEKPVLCAASHSTSLKASLIASYPSVVHSHFRAKGDDFLEARLHPRKRTFRNLKIRVSCYSSIRISSLTGRTRTGL